MRNAPKLVGMALAAGAAAAFAAAPAQAAETDLAVVTDPVTAATTAVDGVVSELMGIGVRDWCDHNVDDDNAPVFSTADAGGSQTGTLSKGTDIRALCGGQDVYQGTSYSGICGGSGNTYLHYTTKPSWSPSQQSRYVPMSCFN
jgi:hypothetical protein